MAPVTWFILALGLIITTGGVSVWFGFICWAFAGINQMAYTWATKPDTQASQELSVPTFDDYDE